MKYLPIILEGKQIKRKMNSLFSSIFVVFSEVELVHGVVLHTICSVIRSRILTTSEHSPANTHRTLPAPAFEPS
jgi:hypothetical protein